MRKQRWTEDDKRRFAEQRLRPTTIPKKQNRGPLPSEWEDLSEEDGSSPPMEVE